MPNVSMTIPEVMQSISRPVAISVIKDIQKITKIDKDVKILFPGDMDRMQQPGTNIGENNRDAEYLNNKFIHIEVIEEYTPDALGNIALTRKEHLPIFSDTALSVYIKPSYVTTDVTINFKYRSSSKTEVLRWRDDIRMHSSQLREMNLHKINYHYSVPEPFFDLLNEIYTLRENVEGYGETFEEYFDSHASNRFTTIGTLDGKQSIRAISETQSRIVGIFDFQGNPEKPEKDDANSSWTISFSYKFTYERPSMCNVIYPIMVHNQMLDNRFINSNRDELDVDLVPQSYTSSLNALHYFEAQEQATHALELKPVINIPDTDEFIAETTPSGTGSVFFALCEVENNKRDLLNLEELGDITIDQDILEFIMKSEYPFICKRYRSILQLDLYTFKNLEPSNSLVCDSNLNVRAVNDLDLRVNSRVRFAIVTDLTMLDRDAIDRLRLYPKAFFKIIIAINEILRNLPGIDSLGLNRRISAADFNILYRYLTGLSFNPGNGIFGKPSDFLKDLRGPSLEYLRANQQSTKTVAITYVVASANKAR
jgi:hypothetical protein